MAVRYESKVYRKAGSTALIVASGGEIEVESGGYISVESGGILNVESGGQLQIGGSAAITTLGYLAGVNGFQEQVVTASSTATSLSTEGGLTFLNNTSNVEYTLPAVVAGMPGLRKSFITLNATTTLAAYVQQPTSGVFFCGANDQICLLAPYQTATVIAGTTTQAQWYYLGGLDTTAGFTANT